MILKDILKDCKGANIKLGFGSGFIYCGKCYDDIDDFLKQQYRKDMRYFTQQVERLENYLATFTTFFNDRLANDLKAAMEKEKAEGTALPEVERICTDVIMKHTEARKKAYDSALDRLKRYIEEINKPEYLNREVLEQYPSIDPEEPAGTVIIIADGLKVGQFYTTKEFKEGR